MRRIWRSMAITLFTLTAVLSGCAQQVPDTVDGLVKVNKSKFDTVYLLPGADFAPYDKVIIDEPEVAFSQGWLRSYNSSAVSGREIRDADAERILSDARKGVATEYAGAFSKAGYGVVTQPAADVLRMKVSVIDLRMNAPDVSSSAQTRTYAREAGEAKIIVEARDSVTGALLGRAMDQQRIGDNLFYERNRVTNHADFRQAFERWARLSVEGLDALKAASATASH